MIMLTDEARFDESITTAWAKSPNRSVAVGLEWLRLVDNSIDVASVSATLLLPADGHGALRGTLHRAIRRWMPGRFIPARAGNTRCGGGSSSTSSVHPRPRGEHDEQKRLGACDHGSSPPARGTLPDDLDAAAPHRFIPTRAGNTASGRPVVRGWSVHPRPRGEHGDPCSGCKLYVGSSPPARGTLGNVRSR